MDGGALAIEWPYLFTGWHEPALWVLAIVVVCSVLNLTANIGLAKAYQSAEASWLAPFDYSYMIFATFWGFVFWGDIPGRADTDRHGHDRHRRRLRNLARTRRRAQRTVRPVFRKRLFSASSGIK